MFAVLLALLLVAGCGNQGGAVPGNIAVDPGGAISFGERPASWKFGWEVPSQVLIAERILRLDHTIHRRYIAYLTPSLTDDNLLLKFSDLKILSVDGVEYPGEMDAQTLFLATIDVLPTLVISPDGELLWVEGIEEAFAQELQALRSYSPGLDEETWLYLWELSESPELQELCYLRAIEMWWSWVGGWVELGIDSGEALEGDMPIADEALTMPFRVEHLGESSFGPEMARLSYHATASGERWKGYLVQQLSAFFALIEIDNAMFAGMLEQMDFQQHISVHLALFPDTLRPIWVCSRQETEITFADFDVVVARESEYTFRWLREQVSTRITRQ